MPEAFDGADMGRGLNEARIMSTLREVVYNHAKKWDGRQIGVLDTAVGGNSCFQLARLLRLLNDEAKESWSVTFHLVHAENVQPFRARKGDEVLHLRPAARQGTHCQLLALR
jgi:hypothetical protein